jgi:hypothetical protein
MFVQPWPEGEYRFFQLGFLVADVFDAARAWTEVFGVGPFHLTPIVEQVATYRGETSAVKIQVAVAQAGPVQIELIQQHCDSPSIYREWHRGRISGLHQLCTVTSDYDGKLSHYKRLGYEVAAESQAGRFRVAYVDTAADFGFYTEIVEETPTFLAQLHTISQTCATWDGSDPIRIMTRDGYRVPEVKQAE